MTADEGSQPHRQHSVDSLSFSQMNLNDPAGGGNGNGNGGPGGQGGHPGDRQRRPSQPASIHSVGRAPSRSQQGSPYSLPPSRASYEGSELPYGGAPGGGDPNAAYQQGMAAPGGPHHPQSEYGADFDPSMYASTSQQGYYPHPQDTQAWGGPGGYYGQDPYQQQPQHSQQHPGQPPYGDPNDGYYDPNTGQYYPYQQQHPPPGSDFYGHSQQYAEPGQYADPAQYGDPYAQQQQQGYPMQGPGGYYEDPNYAASQRHQQHQQQVQYMPQIGYPQQHQQEVFPPPHVPHQSIPPPPQHQQPPSLSRARTTASTKSGTSDRDRSQPITKQAVDDYRNRIKSDPDPETQFNFARFLIEAARRLAVATQQGGVVEDAKSVKKYRDSLLQEALKLIKRLATQGSGLGKPAYADAQFFLANCLGHGALGLAVDHEKAYNLYVQASKQNHPAATYRTAVCNEVGAGTRRDPNRAFLFYRKASSLGDTAGMYKLGMILLGGLLGQQRNPREAVTWLKKAAGQADEENPHALHELAALYEKQQEFTKEGQPIPLPVVRDEPQARELYTQAAQLGHPPSQYRLGSCYEYGSLTCPVDPRRSIAWYTVGAAQRGSPRHAMSRLTLR